VSTTFWATHQVGGPYATLEESQRALDERAVMYPTLYELMPIGFPGKTVLDYGCGPGHDTILFAESGAGHVFYYDVSPLALEILEARLKMHGLVNRASPVKRCHIPKVDHVHCAGVLHHSENPLGCLKDMRRALKIAGEARVMIYDGDLSKHTQSDVPITVWWKEWEFIALARMAGFQAEKVGVYECSAPWRPDCFAACYTLC
jgi:ubiquinone/menaquinone biosynthesis C-methylase UbiE